MKTSSHKRASAVSEHGTPAATADPCVQKLRVLADRTRLSVLKAVIDEPRYVRDLMDLLGIEQSLLSHHLRVLRDSGLVAAERDGKSVLYRAMSARPGHDGVPVIDLGCCQLFFSEPCQSTQAEHDGGCSE